MRMPHVRRPRFTYANVMATFAVFLGMSMGGAYAHGMIGSNQIQSNAVKSKHIAGKQVKTGDLAGGAVATAKIKNNAVKLSKLAPANRPTHETQWRFGAHNFAAEDNLYLRLPGVSRAQVQQGHWEASVIASTPGPPTLAYNIPLAYGDSAEGPVALILWVSAPEFTGALVQISDNDDEFDGVTVSGIRLSHTTRPTAIKTASKFVIRDGARLRLP